MLSFLNLLMNVAIIWTNEVVNIPLGESLEDYKNLPQASIYLDNKLANDRLMFYEYEINYTSFSVIRTNVIGTYTVWYRAHFPSLGFESDVPISFVVYDNLAPEIIGEPMIEVDVGTKQLDYKSLITYKDNYDSFKDLNLSIHSSNVQLSSVGEYEVLYTVTDLSLNQAKFIQKIQVVDKQKPIINQKMQIELNMGEKIDIDKYFTVTDNYDKVLNIKIDDHLINYDVEGTYSAQIIASDQSGNETIKTFNVIIKDNNAPIIHLKINLININYKDEISIETLKGYISRVEDNIDNISIDDVKIESFIESDFLGNYEVIYSVTDSNGLKGTAKLNVKVLDLEPPKIELIKPIKVDVNTLEPYIYDYLLITDNYDDYNHLTITKTGTINMKVVDTYRIIIKVKDQAKNEIEYPILVDVVDTIPPILEFKEVEVITNYSRPNYNELIKVSDNYDKTLNLIIDDSHIDYSLTGQHQIKVTAIDQQNNQTNKYLTLKIIDQDYPEIFLTTRQIYVPYGTEEINYLDYVEKIYDYYDKTLTLDNLRIESQINFSKIGLYKVIYKLKDSSNNETSEILYVYLNDYEPPNINVQTIILNKGDAFDYKKYVDVSDNYDKDLINHVKMNPTYLPTNINGHYEVIFYVHDSSGNYSELKVLITINDSKYVIDYIFYISGAIGIILIVLSYYIYRKKHEKF
ncbi:hypothetical protein [Acholeplasma granularum]|uniref:hypothetical protein n=1 Tax=Acholeplasma granularum TaxID=264635 RepID=UPI000472AA56|nr:hypothetical protein [Acholeplasma granularum]